jgi:hypothetical protein
MLPYGFLTEKENPNCTTEVPFICPGRIMHRLKFCFQITFGFGNVVDKGGHIFYWWYNASNRGK